MPGILVIWWKARWKIQHSEWLMAVSNILKYLCISKLKYQEEVVSAGRKIFVCNAQIITFASRQMRICVTWASFHFTCHYFNTQTGNWQFHAIFLSIRIVLRWFYQLIFYFEKFTLESDDCHLLKERLSFTYTANGNRQIQVWISQNRK